jgi:hypothetical protein
MKMFSKREFVGPYTALFEDEFSWTHTSPDLNRFDYFLWMYLKDIISEKRPHTFLELKTSIQSEIEATSAEPLTKILKNFYLHEFHNLHGHHVEYFSVPNKLSKCVKRSMKDPYSWVHVTQILKC